MIPKSSIVDLYSISNVSLSIILNFFKTYNFSENFLIDILALS